MNPLRHIGLRHIHLDVTDSTNSRAAELANDPRYAGTVITADLQAQGRGQYGRVWQSPPGANVLLSTLLFPPPALRRPAVLTAFAAVAVCDTVHQFTGQEPRIKWPNDVLLDGQKIAGILIECGDSGREVPHCVVGIGLNVNLSADDVRQMQLPNATSLSQLVGQCLEVADVSRRLIQNLDADYGHLIERGTADLESRWVDRLGLVGQLVVAERMDATQTRGRLVGLGFDAVIIERDDGTVLRLLPEEVRHLR
jgi:BirA family transcriptional regulator, biotin operon repressor / biotin---[acetyl-CoA-carboxylase] ligase